VLGWVGQGMLIKLETVNGSKIFFIKQIREKISWMSMLAWVKIDPVAQSGFI
jgi:hypothetical protein